MKSPLRHATLLAFGLLSACKATPDSSNQSSSSTNWLTCQDAADCVDHAPATCSSDGYCLDADGARIPAGALGSADDEREQTPAPSETPASDDDGGDEVAPVTELPLDDDVPADDLAPGSDDDAPTANDDAIANDDAVTSDDDAILNDDAVTSDDDAVANDDAVTSDDDAIANDDAVSSDAGTPDAVDDDVEALDGSPGTVTLQLQVQDGYCNVGPYCDGPRGHISVVHPDDGAVLLPADTPLCAATPCESCEAEPCVGAACVPTQREVSNETVVWDGAFQRSAACGSPESACVETHFAPPGRYLARMCATPGLIVASEPDQSGIATTCEVSGPPECHEVLFDFPSDAPVVGRLPSTPLPDDGTGGAGGGPGTVECEAASDCDVAGLDCCDGRCVNLYNDPLNCGACGNECDGAESYCADTCQAPQCLETCGGGQICCLLMVGPWAAMCTDPVEGTCPVGCPECVCAAPDTPIATPQGERPINELAVGDLVYSIANDAIVPVPIAAVRKTPVSEHEVVRVELASGRTLRISARHPTADGRDFGMLRAQGELDGVRILRSEFEPYRERFTHDILPLSETGVYFAAGVAIGSTLHEPR